MESYTIKTHGSFIQERESSITWNTKYTDPMYGKLQSKELINYIQTVFESLPIEVFELNTKVIVRPAEFRNDKFLRQLLSRDQFFKQGEKLDFILYIGSGQLSEDNIKFLNRV